MGFSVHSNPWRRRFSASRLGWVGLLGKTPVVDPDPVRTKRKQIADKFLSGQGIEVGALHNPLPAPPSATVKYVDRMPVEQLLDHYPNLGELVPVDILDDGETLSTIESESLDFVIANHMLEHCQDPIGTLNNHLRVLKSGGILYLAIPDKRHTFDIDRPLPTIEHLERDYSSAREWITSRRSTSARKLPEMIVFWAVANGWRRVQVRGSKSRLRVYCMSVYQRAQRY